MGNFFGTDAAARRDLRADPPPADADTLARRALVLLHDARRAAAFDAAGAPLPLQHQDRRRWDAERIQAALRLVDRAFASPGVGATTLRAAIECLHAQAPSAAATDWRRIAALYDHLAEVEPTAETAHERALAHRRAGTPAGRPPSGDAR